MTALPKIGAVVLTYNSAEDLPECLEGLKSQVGVDLRVIVVDNASAPTSRDRMIDVFRRCLPGGKECHAAEASAEHIGESRAVFVINDRNAGYSAGNNLGARLAVALGCEAVLILNPDVRITDPSYVATLAQGMRDDPACLIASSRIVGLSGHDENPLRETTYWEELLWPRQIGPKRFRPRPMIVPLIGTQRRIAEKVHGCCMLLAAGFLKSIGYLDENVFLYSEEAILAAQVRSHGGRIVVFPQVQALHAHVASAKGNPSRRMLQFIKSRLYYLDAYTNYSPAKRRALRASYGVLAMAHRIRAHWAKAEPVYNRSHLP